MGSTRGWYTLTEKHTSKLDHTFTKVIPVMCTSAGKAKGVSQSCPTTIQGIPQWVQAQQLDRGKPKLARKTLPAVGIVERRVQLYCKTGLHASATATIGTTLRYCWYAINNVYDYVKEETHKVYVAHSSSIVYITLEKCTLMVPPVCVHTVDWQGVFAVCRHLQSKPNSFCTIEMST